MQRIVQPYSFIDNTFSVVGRCAETGDFGVVVSTARVAVGSRVPFAAAGIGAVAIQANNDPRLGRKALRLLIAGATAQAALEQTLAADEDRESRQLSIVDARGNVAGVTGSLALQKNVWAGTRIGKDCVAAGNLLAGPDVVRAMGETFEATQGFLGERLLQALEAGQAAGGDKRGKISAAILVVRQDEQPLLDLRVDSSADPVAELRRVYTDYMEHVFFALNPTEAGKK